MGGEDYCEGEKRGLGGKIVGMSVEKSDESLVAELGRETQKDKCKECGIW